MSKAQKIRKTEARNWSLIIYPDSAPKDWEKILDEQHVKWACSPLHDKDIDENAEGGAKVKKPHYHVVITFEGNKSFEQVCEITKSLNTVHPQVCHSVVGSLRYFTHKDNPEKYQYDPTEIRAFSGFDADKYLEMTTSMKKKVCSEILSFIIKYHVTEYADLFFTVYSENKADWLDVMMQSNYAQSIKMMLSSMRHTSHKPFNPMTGEVADVVEEKELNEEEEECEADSRGEDFAPSDSAATSTDDERNE